MIRDLFRILLALLVLASVMPAVAYRAKARSLGALGTAFLTVVALVCGTTTAIGSWVHGAQCIVDLSRLSPFAFVVSVDRLSGFFLFLVCAVSIPAVLYSIPYIAHHYERLRAAWYWILLPLFLLSMVLVVCANTAFAFFSGWELMTLLSAALVILEGDSEGRRRSVFVYLLMMHAGAALVISAFLLFLPYTSSLDFNSLRAAVQEMPGALKSAIFLLAFFGFGTKAGIIPLHIWLPKAHPIAPTPVSALMSGIMLKTAVYAFLRFAFDFLAGGPEWGGYVVLAAGAISAVLGILYAIFEIDLKRLLAYSSVENIGIIYMVMGVALIGTRNGAPAVAGLALLAVLIHCLNHAIFKNLLFLSAGAVHERTNTLKLNDLGGLLRSMPVAGMIFLIGCIAIAGLPLFNGFVGEWIAFQSFLAGAQVAGTTPQLVIPLMAGVLALTGGLAAACFVNVYGTAFLGRPRNAAIEVRQDAPASMLLPMGLLGGACIVLGLAPMVLIRPLWSLTQAMIPGGSFEMVAGIGGSIQKVALLAAGIAGAAALLRAAVRTSPNWACGLAGLTTRMQYTATCFSKPIRTVFSRVYKPDRKLEFTPADSPYFPKAISYQSTRTMSYEKLFYRPVFNSILSAARQLRRFQTGNIQLYLLYIFLALISMLLLMRLR